MQKRDFFLGGIRMCCTVALNPYPKGYSSAWSTTRATTTQGKHIGDNARWRSSTVRFGLRDLAACSCDAILPSN